MSDTEKHYQWEWTLKSSPEAIWTFFADTNQLNQDTGVFPVEAMEGGRAHQANARRDLQYQLPIPLTITFTEEPFEWVYPYRYGVERRFHKGPIDIFRVLAQFEPTADGGTHLVYDVWITPRNILGKIGADLAIGKIAKARFSKAIAQYDEIASANVAPFVPRSVHLASGGEARITQMQTQLESQGFDPTLVASLFQVVRNADDLTVSRLRPYYYADFWG